MVGPKRPKKVHFALSAYSRSPSPEVTARDTTTVRASKVERTPEITARDTTVRASRFERKVEFRRSPSPEIARAEERRLRRKTKKQNLKVDQPEQATTYPPPGARPDSAQKSNPFRYGKIKLPKLDLGRRLYNTFSSSPTPVYQDDQSATMAPPPLSPYEVESPDEILPPRRAGYYSGPLMMGDVYSYEPRGASVPTRGYALPIPILRSPSPSRSRSACGDVQEKFKITHTKESPAIGASHRSSRQASSRHGHAYEAYHFCSVCRQPRSRKYHHDHPVEPGQRIDPAICGKCKTEDNSSDDEERVVIERPGRKLRGGVLETERVKVVPVVEESERGRPRHKARDSQRETSGSRVYINVKEREGRRGRQRSRSDSRVQITIEETMPARHRRSRSRTVVRVQEWQDRARRRSLPPSTDTPAKQPTTVRHVTDAEKKLKSHPQAFRHGIFTKSKSKERTRAPSPPSAGMSKLSMTDPPPHIKARTEASQHTSRSRRGSQAARTHTSWVTYPASSPPESPKADHETRSTSTLRSGTRPSRPATSPRKHMQARHSSHREEGMNYYDETRVRFTPGPTDEQARRRRGYDGHFSEDVPFAEGMREYYWMDAPRQWSATPRHAMPSSEPTSYTARGYRRIVDEPEPPALVVDPRAPMTAGPVRITQVPSEAFFEPAADNHAPASRPWTQHSSNVGGSIAGSRGSYHLVDVREVDDVDSMGYPTRVREIEDTRYSGGEMDRARLRMEERERRGYRRG